MGKKAGRDCLDAFLRQGGYERLRAYVARRFPRLADRADDLIQIALMELLENEKDEPAEAWTPSGVGFRGGYGGRSAPEPDRPWLPSLMKRIAGRALDALRRVEHVALSALAQNEEGAGDAVSPRSDAAAVDPASVTTLVTSGPGRVCLALGLGLDVLGALWMRRIVRSEP